MSADTHTPPGQPPAGLASVRLLILDVDGVLSDGAVYLDGERETKRFGVTDATGIKYLLRQDIEVAVVSGRESAATTQWAAELKLTRVHQKSLKKLPVVEQILTSCGLQPEQAAYVGDDLVDLPPMRHVGVGIAVADAHSLVRQQADWVTQNKGGQGAVREICEEILNAQDLMQNVLARYLPHP